MGEGLHTEVWVTQTRLTLHLMGDSLRKAYSWNLQLPASHFLCYLQLGGRGGRGYPSSPEEVLTNSLVLAET